MPQWRKLHTKTVESLDVNDMPDDFTRLMWVLLPLKLCREGRGLDMATWIKSQVFPLRSDVTLEMVEDAMHWYASRGMIERYAVDGRPYFQIVNWHKYQGNTDREADSPYPGPDEADSESQSRPTHERVASESGTDADADADADAEQPRARGDAFIAYENAFGTYGAHMAEVIKGEIDDHGEEWVVDAIHEAAENNAKSFKYAQAILDRWAQEGKGPRASPNGHAAAEEAWSVVESALNQGDAQPIMDRPDVLSAVNDCGRWPVFRDCRPDKLTWKKKEFVEAYNAQR